MVQIEKIKSKVLEIGKISPLINFSGSKTQNALEICNFSGTELYKYLKENGSAVLDCLESVQKDSLKVKANRTEYSKALEKIYAKYKEITNEQGVNSLYIVIGFVKWVDSDESDLYSPLVLVPVTMERNLKLHSRGNYEYSLHLSEEEMQFNVSLIQKFIEEKVKIDIPTVNNSTDLKALFSELKEKMLKYSFKIDEKIVLGIFYNARINIYNDLTENADKVINHPIVRAIDGDQSAIPALKVKEKMDDEFSYQKTFLPVSYDSSQLKAISEVSKGKSLVIEGPPGTGKSQTITNIIADAVNNRKSVLFVAEKKAALDVVANNLKRVALDDYYLYIDSNKANKKIIFNSLYDSLMKKPVLLKDDAYEILKRLDELKDDLDKYCDFVNSTVKNSNLTFYDLFSRYIEVIDYKYINPHINDIKKVSFGELEDRTRFINRYNKYLDDLNINSYKDNMYYGYKDSDISLVTKEELLSLFNKVLKGKNLLEVLPEEIAKYSLYSLYFIYDLSCNRPNYLNKNLFVLGNINAYYKQMAQYFAFYNKSQSIKEEILKNFKEEVLDAKVCGSLHIVPSEITIESIKKHKTDIKKNLKVLKKYSFEKLTLENVCLYTTLLKDYYNTYMNLKSCEVIFTKVTSDDYAKEDVYKTILKIKKLLDSTKDTNYLDIIFSDENHLNEFTIVKEYIDLITKINNFYDTSIVDFSKLTYSELIEKIKLYVTQIDTLGMFNSLVKDMKNYKDTGLFEFIEESLSQNVSRSDLESIYYKGYYSLLIDSLSKEYEIINNFSCVKEENEINDYTLLDDLYSLIAIVKTRENVSLRKPNPNSQSTKSEIGILKSQKDKPTMSIKELFNNIKRLLLRIKPVMIMSPLSVSTYLPSDIEFDIVIFDEASQIQKEDALCPIYRGKQIVVVGDTEQLPPTDFFKKMALDGDDEEEANDGLAGTSLLDLANTFLESVRLKWHYRSKNEELITFSNHYIYKDYLITFPISRMKKDDEGLEYYYVEKGIYDRGGTRTNKEEAKVVSKLVIENIIKYPERSIGVVTFSVCQRNCIQNTLMEELKNIKQEDLEKYNKIILYINDESVKEPFFIKNLENVQGDERDTIIFSVCYGKDSEEGELFYNLGRLTRDEGRKRINVATSRSKINMKVVCSFDPETLVISKEEQTGLAALKKFLCYAKTKVIDDINDKQKTDLIISEQIVSDIEKNLRERGLKTERNIGNSEFKIRLGVYNPEKETEFIMGITLDDNIYKECKSVRDRDKLWPRVLRQMGWNIFRVYSTDYIKNRSLVIDKILVAIDKAIKGESEIKSVNDQSYKQFEKEIEHGTIIFDTIRETKYDDILSSNMSYSEKFSKAVYRIVKNEGAIHIKHLAKRMLKFFNTSEVTKNLLDLIPANIKEHGLYRYIYNDGDFYMTQDSDNSFKKSTYRRTIDEIYYKELADLINTIIGKSIGISAKQVENLIKEYVGYDINKQLNASEKETITKAFEYLLKEGKIELVDDLLYKC